MRWDVSFARNCWIDWSQYDYRRRDIDFNKFENFSNDIDNVEKQKLFCPLTKIIWRIKGVTKCTDI